MTTSPVWPYRPALDRAYKAIGVYSEPYTTWTLPSADPGVNRIVLGEAFGAKAGSVLVPIFINGNKVQVEGDFTAGEVTLGREYDSWATLSKPIPKGPTGVPIQRGVRTVREIVVQHSRTSSYDVRSTWTGPGIVRDRVKKFRAAMNSDMLLKIDYEGRLTARHNGNADFQDIIIQNESIRPHTIVAAEILYDYAGRR
jgi:hypothetical protein